MPRVWWKPKAIETFENGGSVEVIYDNTVGEQSANNLFDWLEKWGAEFGWIRTYDLTELQLAANEGKVALISAKNQNRGISGHICAVVPEVGEHKAIKDGLGKVLTPLQSQAGGKNFSYGYLKDNRGNWWTWPQFKGVFGFWIHI